MSFPADQEDYTEADQEPQDHYSYPSEDWSCSLRDRLHLLNRYQSTINLGQHSLCRGNQVLSVRKPRFAFTHTLTPLFSRLERSQLYRLHARRAGISVPRSPAGWRLLTVATRHFRVCGMVSNRRTVRHKQAGSSSNTGSVGHGLGAAAQGSARHPLWTEVRPRNPACQTLALMAQRWRPGVPMAVQIGQWPGVLSPLPPRPTAAKQGAGSEDPAPVPDPLVGGHSARRAHPVPW